MSPEVLRALASAILYLHFAIVLFNLFWLAAVPIGAWRHWDFVRSFWWRAAHLASLAVVAIQVIAGSLCVLTIWQNDLLRAAGGTGDVSMIERLVTRAVFWPLPIWAFAVLYVAALVYAVALWWWVPPHALRRR